MPPPQHFDSYLPHFSEGRVSLIPSVAPGPWSLKSAPLPSFAPDALPPDTRVSGFPERLSDSMAPQRPSVALRSIRARSMRPSLLPSTAPARDMSPAEVSRLLKAHTPLVKRIVGGILRRVPGHILVDDLIAAGLSGLWDAIRRCGHLPPDHFRRYAGVRIRGAVYDELRAQDWLPRRMRAAINAKVRRDEKVTLGVVFLEDLSDAEQPPISDDPQTLNGEEFLAAKAFGQRLVDALERLPARERRIILGHHLQGLKLRDLGAELKVTDARVSQLHGRAMKRLKAMMAEAEDAS
jgi:RNA polymerase sigma factor for flagellar operon FliA